MKKKNIHSVSKTFQKRLGKRSQAHWRRCSTNWLCDRWRKSQNIRNYEQHKETKHTIRRAALKHLQSLQESHSKVKTNNIKCHTLKLQQCMCAPNMNNYDTALPLTLCTSTGHGMRKDFGGIYQWRHVQCSVLQCHICPLCIEVSHMAQISEGGRDL